MTIAPVFVGGRDNEVILTSTRDATTGGKRKSNITGTRFADLFTSKFEVQKQKWGTPKLLEENLIINTASDEGAATLSGRGDLMIFYPLPIRQIERYGRRITGSEPVERPMVGTYFTRIGWRQPDCGTTLAKCRWNHALFCF